MKKIIFLFTLLIIGGCANVRVALYNKDVHYPATDPQKIEIFQKKPEVRQFIEIGEITVDGASSRDQADRIFRIKAAEYGGNAVYIYSQKEETATYVSGRVGHYYDGFYYPHARRYPGMHYYPRHHGYFPRYYYCYGYPDIETATFFTVVGIVVRYI